MNVNDFLMLLGQQTWILLAYFTSLPILSFLFSLGYQSGGQRQVRDYVFSGFVYLSFLPGIFSGILVFYTLLILRQNLLEVDIVLYYVPIISMSLVYWVLGRVVDFDRLPGFGRLAGLMVLLALICLVVFFLYRLRFVVAFFGSMEFLLGAACVVFLLFKWAGGKIKGQK